MPDSTGLAGVIGTWIAVLFAVVALVGIVAPMLILRQTRSERYKAIKAIDTTKKTGYVVTHLKLPGQNHLFLSVKTPRLDQPPDAPTHFSHNTQNTVPHKETLSTTGWVNLIEIIEAYSTKQRRYRNNLIIQDGDTWFPMHHLWLLIVGLRGRYGYRKDGGKEFQSRPGNLLPIEISRAGSKWQNTPSAVRLSGTTGTLWWKRALDSSERCINEVYFARHQRKKKITEQDPDPISISDLVWLSLGCLPSKIEGKVFDLEPFPNPPEGRRRTWQGHEKLFFKYEKREIDDPGPHEGWAKATGITMKTLHSQTRIDPNHAGWSELVENAKNEIGDWFAFDKTDKYYLWRPDAYSIASGIIQLDLCSTGVLVDHRRASESITSIFGKFHTKMLRLLEDLPDGFASNFEELIQLVQSGRNSFSQRQSELSYQLDGVLQKRTSELGSPQRLVLEVVGILTLTSQIFLEALTIPGKITLEVNCTANNVTLLAGNAKVNNEPLRHEYHMQVSEICSKEVQEGVTQEALCYDDKSMMLCAAISAALRGLMLEQSIDSRPLINLVLRAEKKVQVAVRDSAPIVMHRDTSDPVDRSSQRRGSAIFNSRSQAGRPQSKLYSPPVAPAEAREPFGETDGGSKQYLKLVTRSSRSLERMDSPEHRMPGSSESIGHQRAKVPTDDDWRLERAEPVDPRIRKQPSQRRVEPALTDTEYSEADNAEDEYDHYYSGGAKGGLGKGGTNS